LLVVVFGLPSSGKTFLAKELASELGFVHMNTDSAKKQLLRRPGCTSNENSIVYEKLFEFISDYLKQGKDLVVDGTFYRRSYREALKDIAGTANTSPVFVEVTAPEKSIEARIERKDQASCDDDADAAIYNKIKSDFEPMEEFHLVVDSTMPLMKQVQRAKFFLEKHA